MPTILTKKSDTPGAVPATANLTNAAGGAELAVNTADKRLFTITSGSQVVEVGTTPSAIDTARVSATVLTSASATITNLLATSLTVSSGSRLDGGVVINEPGADADFRVEGDTDANLIFADASTDNVGVGTSSPQAKLVASNGGANGYELDPVNGFISAYNRSTDAWTKITTRASSYTFNLNNSNDALNLDASGNLGLGVTPTNFSGRTTLEINNATDGGLLNLLVNGTRHLTAYVATGATLSLIGTASNTDFGFVTNNTERARITSGGDLLVGTTSTTLNGSGAYISSIGQGVFSTGSGGAFINFINNANSVIGSISNSGNTATAYNTSSDRRLKENISAADDAGAVIDAIEIVKHDWKVGGHVRYGVIAQDLHEVAPEAVSAGDDGEEVERAWGVDYSKLVPMLVKEIQSLRARVAALEGT